MRVSQPTLVFRMLIFMAVLQQIKMMHSRKFKRLQQEPPRRKKKIHNGWQLLENTQTNLKLLFDGNTQYPV